jgi:hypothetical protein
MSDIEDRLRAELWAQSQRTQAEDLRDLRVPSRPTAPARRRGRWWLAPAAAPPATTRPRRPPGAGRRGST